MLCILKAIFTWVLLVFLSMNLVGFATLGIFRNPPQIDAPSDRMREILDSQQRRMTFGKIIWTLFSFAGVGAYLFVLYRYWGVGLATAGFILMLTRLPEVLWEDRTGTRIDRQNAPRGPLYIAATVIQFGTAFLVWYSLCK